MLVGQRSRVGRARYVLPTGRKRAESERREEEKPKEQFWKCHFVPKLRLQGTPTKVSAEREKKGVRNKSFPGLRAFARPAAGQPDATEERIHDGQEYEPPARFQGDVIMHLTRDKTGHACTPQAPHTPSRRRSPSAGIPRLPRRKAAAAPQFPHEQPAVAIPIRPTIIPQSPHSHPTVVPQSSHSHPTVIPQSSHSHPYSHPHKNTTFPFQHAIKRN